MAKTKKLNQPITQQRTFPSSAVEKYRELFIPRERPVSIAFIERLCADLIDWAINDDDALKIIDFYVSRKIHPKTFWRWEQKYPMLTDARNMALNIIGSRREKGALKKKFEPTVMMKQQHHYDKTWWEDEVARAELRARTQQKTDQNIRYTVVLDSYADTVTETTDNLPKEQK